MKIKSKSVWVGILAILGVYFLLFHSEPFPFSHNAIGLPPYHTVHAVFGVLLLAKAIYLWRKK